MHTDQDDGEFKLSDEVFAQMINGERISCAKRPQFNPANVTSGSKILLVGPALDTNEKQLTILNLLAPSNVVIRIAVFSKSSTIIQHWQNCSNNSAQYTKSDLAPLNPYLPIPDLQSLVGGYLRKWNIVNDIGDLYAEDFVVLDYMSSTQVTLAYIPAWLSITVFVSSTTLSFIADSVCQAMDFVFFGYAIEYTSRRTAGLWSFAIGFWKECLDVKTRKSYLWS